MSKIQKTTITFTVLHRKDDPVLNGSEFVGEYDSPTDGLLGYVMRESWDGGMVGLEGDPSTVDVPEEEVANELIALGNDGTFFEEEG